MSAAQAGHPGEARTARLQEELRRSGLDALLVETGVDLRWLTGFTGSNGLALVRAQEGTRPLFLTDFRYESQSEQELPAIYERRIVAGEALGALAEELVDRGLGEAVSVLGFDETLVTVARLQGLREALPEGWEPRATSGMVAELRLVKEPAEIESMRAASTLADEALLGVLEGGLEGRTEREVAIDLEFRMRRLGAEGPSFSSIVAAGPHGALPHATPREAQIPRDVLVTIDWGALLDGYCSDCTRTYATGEAVSERGREVYELVLAAQLAGLAAVQPGRSGREIDAVSREVIEQAGFGERFGHGLGHGVGMEIHEAPRLSRTASEDPIPQGAVVTVEPGVYLPGELGVRIEDLVVVTASGCELLTSLPKELTVVG